MAREETEIAPTHTTGAVMRYVSRFDTKSRVLHLVTMTSFLMLSATGLPLLFSDEAWARALARALGGFQTAGLVHRFFGVALLSAVGYHLIDIFWRAVVRRERGLLWGPSSMVPQPRDVRDFFTQMRWFFGASERPRFEHFAYWEKFDYWAVLWGTLIMGAAGVLMWFPEAASRLVPGWMFNVALFVHGAEATLAIGFIFVIHFFNGHLRPGKFPMDLVIFTGRVTDVELRHERAGQYDRLSRSGELDRMIVSAPTATELRRSRIVGATGLIAGIALVLLIVYAVL